MEWTSSVVLIAAAAAEERGTCSEPKKNSFQASSRWPVPVSTTGEGRSRLYHRRASHKPTNMSHHPEVPDDHYRPTYEDIHQHIASTARQIRATFRPDLIVAIGGGGFFPARVLRTFLKRNVGGDKLVNVPIQAIGLSLYEDLASDETNTSGPTAKGKIGLEVVRTQWLDAPKREGDDALTGGLLGKNILIVVRGHAHHILSTFSYADFCCDGDAGRGR